MKKLKIILVFILLVTIPLICAETIVSNLNVTSPYFIGDGSGLTNINNSNSTNWWSGLSSWQQGWFENNGGILNFNETKLNESISSSGSIWNLSGTNDIYYNTGNIGIGTSTPSAMIDTTGFIRSTGINSIPTTGKGLEFFYQTAQDYGALQAYDRDASNYKPLRISSSATSFSQGYVGINTTSPQRPLHVNGEIVSDLNEFYANLRLTRGTNPSVILRNDGVAYYFLISDTQYGLWNANRPFAITLSTGEVKIGSSNTLRAYPNGAVQMPKVYTDFFTGNPANLYINSAGQLFRSTSSTKYKEDIKYLNPEDSQILYDMNPFTYKSKNQEDDPTKRFYGLSAEELDSIDKKLVHYGENESVEGVQYERIIPLLINEIKNLNNRITELENVCL